MTDAGPRIRTHLAREAALVVLVVLVYLAPLVAGWRATRFSPIPPRLTPDLYLHLVLSDLPRAGPGAVLNPWYQIPVVESELVYRRFGSSLRAFHLLSSALGGRLALAVLAWTLLWTVLICLAGRWLCSLLFDRARPAWVALGLGLLMLVDAGYLQWVLSQALQRTPATVPAFPILPYLRPFFPQVAIPFLLLYLGLQIRVLGEPRGRYWLAMGAVQFLALTAFPFATLLMAAITAVAMLFAAGGSTPVPWRHLVGFALVCGTLDLLFVAWNAPALRLLTGHGSLLRPDLTRFRLILGYTVSVVTGLSIVVAFSIRRRSAVRYTLTGLGFGIALLLLSDGILSPSLQTSHHIWYFVHTVMAVLAIGLIGEAQPWLERHGRRMAPLAAVSVAGATLIYGGAAGYLTHRWYLPRNAPRAQLVTALSTAAPDDLIVAPNDMLEDETSWLPLASKGRVLFSRSAEFVLGAADAAEDARRLALFLYLRGETAESTRAALWQRGVSPHQRFLVGFRRTQLLSSGERERVLDGVERELLPALRDAERLAPDVVRFFRRYRRILVIDRIDDPFFRADRVTAVVRLDGERRLAEPWILRWGSPR